jgi:hypothetical protein
MVENGGNGEYINHLKTRDINLALSSQQGGR